MKTLSLLFIAFLLLQFATLAQERWVDINSEVFNEIILDVFEDASIASNSCGSYLPRTIRNISKVPTAYKVIEIPFLKYKFTDNEKEETISSVGDYGRIAIRACVNAWYLESWFGFVENDKFKITLDMGYFTIQTRAKDFVYFIIPTPGGGIPVEMPIIPDWESDASNYVVPDLIYQGPIVVSLIPIRDNDSLSYNPFDVMVSWSYTKTWEEIGYWGYESLEKRKFETYGEERISFFRNLIINTFRSSDIRSAIKEKLTHYVKIHTRNRSIVRVVPMGDIIRVYY